MNTKQQTNIRNFNRYPRHSCPVGKIAKKWVWRSVFLVIRNWKYSAILSKIPVFEISNKYCQLPLTQGLPDLLILLHYFYTHRYDLLQTDQEHQMMQVNVHIYNAPTTRRPVLVPAATQNKI